MASPPGPRPAAIGSKTHSGHGAAKAPDRPPLEEKKAQSRRPEEENSRKIAVFVDLTAYPDNKRYARFHICKATAQNLWA
jgi:hypothetical protein